MRVTRIGTAVAGVVAATALATSPAFATGGTYDLGDAANAHTAKGGVVFLSRSVTVQGSVTDVGGAGTQIEFDAFAGNTRVDVQTRTAVNKRTDYNFALDGSQWPGGITQVNIWLTDLHTHSTVDYDVFWRS